MNTNEIVIKNVRNWLKENNQTHQWLAQKLNVSKALVGHMLNRQRAILPERIEALSNVLDIPIEELLKDSTHSDELSVHLRGKTSNRQSKKELKNVLFSIEDYVGLKGR